jgi:hypothetical protein
MLCSPAASGKTAAKSSCLLGPATELRPTWRADTLLDVSSPHVQRCAAAPREGLCTADAGQDASPVPPHDPSPDATFALGGCVAVSLGRLKVSIIVSIPITVPIKSFLLAVSLPAHIEKSNGADLALVRLAARSAIARNTFTKGPVGAAWRAPSVGTARRARLVAATCRATNTRA